MRPFLRKCPLSEAERSSCDHPLHSWTACSPKNSAVKSGAVPRLAHNSLETTWRDGKSRQGAMRAHKRARKRSLPQIRKQTSHRDMRRGQQMQRHHVKPHSDTSQHLPQNISILSHWHKLLLSAAFQRGGRAVGPGGLGAVAVRGSWQAGWEAMVSRDCEK